MVVCDVAGNFKQPKAPENHDSRLIIGIIVARVHRARIRHAHENAFASAVTMRSSPCSLNHTVAVHQENDTYRTTDQKRAYAQRKWLINAVAVLSPANATAKLLVWAWSSSWSLHLQYMLPPTLRVECA
jgi:hypothetical protein